MTSGRITEAELEDLKSRNPCDIVAGGWVSLRRHGQKMVGPCPICSADPKSRDATRFECWADGWVCAVCADGGDVIRLVERVNGCSFMDAIAFLGGKRELVPGEAMLAEAHRAKLRAERERESKAYRERERRKLWAMWHPAVPIAGTVAESYLALRHLTAPVTSTARLRYLANCPMYVTGAASTKPVHTGPAMLAAIVGADGRFSGLHITWLDLARPKGKAEVPDPTTGDLLPAKKVRGSKSGGRIEIVPRAAPRRLIIGEGIETVLAVWTALDGAGQDLTDTAFWSAVDLGNLGGRAAATVPHPTLKTANNHTRRVPGPVPDQIWCGSASNISMPRSQRPASRGGSSSSRPIRRAISASPNQKSRFCPSSSRSSRGRPPAKRRFCRRNWASRSRPRASVIGSATAATRPGCQNAVPTGCARSALRSAPRTGLVSISSWLFSIGARPSRRQSIPARPVGGFGCGLDAHARAILGWSALTWRCLTF